MYVCVYIYIYIHTYVYLSLSLHIYIYIYNKTWTIKPVSSRPNQDITELKKASERAQRVADDLTRLIDTANAPIFGIDMEGKVTERSKTKHTHKYSQSK